MTSVLVTGSSRGIGFALVRSLLTHANPPKLVIATCRSPESAAGLKELSQQHSGLVILKLDVDKLDSFPDFALQVENIVGENGLNVLINNAGIGTRTQVIEDANPEDFLRIMQTNVLAPVFLTKALLPLIRKAALKNKDRPLGMSRAAIINITSVLGSISLNCHSKFHFWGYSSSKAALNQATRGLALELDGQGIVVVPLHPGWVRTDMGGSEADISVEECVSGLTKVLYGLSEKSHNKFLQWDGKELTW